MIIPPAMFKSLFSQISTSAVARVSELYQIIFEDDLAVLQWLQAKDPVKAATRCPKQR